MEQKTINLLYELLHRSAQNCFSTVAEELFRSTSSSGWLILIFSFLVRDLVVPIQPITKEHQSQWFLPEFACIIVR